MTKKNAEKDAARARQEERGGNYQHHLRKLGGAERKEFPLDACLYCRDATRPRTAEHVLQKGFGANLTLGGDVCADCNTRVFSPLDGDLLWLARSLLYWDHPDVARKRLIIEGPALMLDAEKGLWVTIRLDRNGKPIIFPQYVFQLNGTVAVFLDANQDAEWQKRTQQMQDELSNPSTLSVSRQIVEQNLGDDVPSLQPAVVRTARNTYVIRAAVAKTADAIEAAIREGRSLTSGALTGPRYGEQSGGTAHKELVFRATNTERAVAKAALNFVCSVVGPLVARGEPFDAIRAFAHGGAGAGFVHWVFGKNVDPKFLGMAAQFTRAGHHSFVLTQVQHVPLLAIVLYERPLAVVRMTPGPRRKALPPDTVVVGLFDYKAKTHEIVKMADDPLEFGKRFSFA
jgi:hypothetical protein